MSKPKSKIADLLFEVALKKVEEATGRKAEAKVQKFMKGFLDTIVELLEESAAKGKIDPKSIGMLAFNRALGAAELAADENSWLACGVSVVSFALTSVEMAGVLSACATAAATGALTAPSFVVALSASLFWAYQANEVTETCGKAYAASVEAQFREDQLVQAKAAMTRNYANMVCKAPDEPNSSQDPLMSVAPR